MKNQSIRNVCVAATLLTLAAGAVAQRKEARAEFECGIGDAGCGWSLVAYSESAALNNGGWEKAVGASASESIHLLGSTRSSRIWADATRRRTVMPNSFGQIATQSSVFDAGIRVAGNTLWSTNISDGSNVYYNLSPTNMFGGGGVQAAFSIAGFSVAVHGNAEARATTSVTPTLTYGVEMQQTRTGFVPVIVGSVGLNGTLRARATGFASASVSLLCGSVSMTSNLTFADTVATLDLDIDLQGLRGSLCWTMQPVRLLMRAVLNYCVGSAPLTIADVSVPAQGDCKPLQ